jgi:hypothetical protein
LKKDPARGTETTGSGSRMGENASRNIGNPLDCSHRFDGQESKERSNQPQAGKSGE